MAVAMAADQGDPAADSAGSSHAIGLTGSTMYPSG